MKARRVSQAPPPPPDLIVLEMTEEEARSLCSHLHRISGDEVGWQAAGRPLYNALVSLLGPEAVNR